MNLFVTWFIFLRFSQQMRKSESKQQSYYQLFSGSELHWLLRIILLRNWFKINWWLVAKPIIIYLVRFCSLNFFCFNLIETLEFSGLHYYLIVKVLGAVSFNSENNFNTFFVACQLFFKKFLRQLLIPTAWELICYRRCSLRRVIDYLFFLSSSTLFLIFFQKSLTR